MKPICGVAIAVALFHCLDLHVQALDNGLAITPPMVRIAKPGAMFLILHVSRLCIHRASLAGMEHLELFS